MNYLQTIWKFEDKLRIIALFVIAASVLVLSCMDIGMDLAEGHPNHDSSLHG